MKNKVLVISHDADGTSKLLIDRLVEMGQPYHLIDLSLFPVASIASIHYTGDKPYVSFQHEDKTFDTNSVKGVWWRRPKGKFRVTDLDALGRYVDTESETFIRSLFYLLTDVTWVSDPEKTRIANSKPLQLKIAKEMGFVVPLTLISNDPGAVSGFIKDNEGLPIIMKPVGTGHFRSPVSEGYEDLAVYTRIIDPEEVMEKINLVQNCPVIFQEAIVDKIDLRITVVGEKVFAVKVLHNIDKGAGSDNLDWRNHKLNRIYEACDLPATLEELCVAYVKYLGLRFGAIDMCLSPDGRYHFLEINPQGQWGPSELVAGHPISQTLANLLVD